MEFQELKQLQQAHVAKMMNGASALYVANVSGDEVWAKYLDSFPPGTNEVFRERREFDCSCCRHFVKGIGNVVTILDNQIVTIWDFDTGDDKFQPVIDALAGMIKTAGIRDVFITKESSFGTDVSHEQRIDTIHAWHHFYLELPKGFVSSSHETEATIAARYRDTKNVLERSLSEISLDAIEDVLDLISQKSLYKGEEWESMLNTFLAVHREYHDLPESERNTYCWATATRVGGAVGRIRNHAIGVLLVDLSNGVDLNEAFRKYGSITDPNNYKHVKAVYTKKMADQAWDDIVRLGFEESLGRRFAMIDDITIGNVLFANRDARRQIEGDDVFAQLQRDAVVNPKQFDRVEEVDIDRFIKDVLPRSTGIEVLFENRLAGNLVSVIAPKVKGSKSMFKWDNGFSWAYLGNITDSTKERVKAAGGSVDGVIRFSIRWNDNDDNPNDLDAHCIEPSGNEIFFANKNNYSTTGSLDVDIIHPSGVAVENITWSQINQMWNGVYTFFVRNFSHRGGRSGFSAEIEYNGEVRSFEYPNALRQGERIIVTRIQFDRQTGVKYLSSLPIVQAPSRTIWNLETGQFHPVTMAMFSPNYWDGQSGIGHRHYFFIVANCLNDGQPNGFFNEFLIEDLMRHKRVLEALGSKMAVEPADQQLSGLGFSSTKRDTLVVKVSGHTARIIKLVF